MKVSEVLELEVVDVLQITTKSLPMAFVGETYSFQLVATGGLAPYTWAAEGLPEGLSLSPEGTLSGIPTVAGKVNPTVTVTDSRPE